MFKNCNQKDNTFGEYFLIASILETHYFQKNMPYICELGMMSYSQISKNNFLRTWSTNESTQKSNCHYYMIVQKGFQP